MKANWESATKLSFYSWAYLQVIKNISYKNSLQDWEA